LNDIKADFKALSDKYIPFGVPVVPLEYIIAHGPTGFFDFIGRINKMSSTETIILE